MKFCSPVRVRAVILRTGPVSPFEPKRFIISAQFVLGSCSHFGELCWLILTTRVPFSTFKELVSVKSDVLLFASHDRFGASSAFWPISSNGAAPAPITKPFVGDISISLARESIEYLASRTG